MIKSCINIALFLCYLSISNQLLGTDTPNRRLRVNGLTQEQGLSHNHIFAIEQDRDGFIWFGTADGLNRYDGYDFVIFRNKFEDSTSLSDNFIHTLLNDRHDNLWVGTISGGLNKFDKKKNTFTRYNTSTSQAISNNVCLSLLEDRNDNIWVGTENGLNRISANKSEVKHFLIDTTDNVDYHQEGMLKLYIDSKEKLWVGTRGGVFFINDFYRKSENNTINFNDKNHITHGEFRDIYEDANGIIWLAGLRGVFYYSPINNQLKKLIDGEFYSLILDDANTLLAGGNSDLYTISILDKTYITQTDFNQFNADNHPVRHLFKDHSDVIWIAMRGFGLAKTNHQKNFVHYASDKNNLNSLGGKIVRAITQDAKDNIWVSNTNFGLNVINLSSGIITQHPSPSHFPVENIYALHGDNQGNIWAGIRTTETIGLIKYNIEDGAIKTFDHSAIENPAISNNHIREIFEDSRGMYWLGLDDGLEVFDPSNEEFIAYYTSGDENNGLAGSSIQSGAITEDDKGNIWVGSWKGVTKISLDSNLDYNRVTFEHFVYKKDSNSLSDNRVISIHYNDNRVWFGTYGGGLVSYNTTTNIFKNYSTADGLANNVVHGIEEDNFGNLWVSTNFGLSKFSIDKEEFENYYFFDGLQHNQFYWGASYKDKDGRLYFGGINGVTAFFPEQIYYDTITPKVVFTELSIFDKKVQVGEKINNKVILPNNINQLQEITLSHKEKIFAIGFSVLHYVEPQRNLFSYKLEGFNDEWTIVESNRRIITYTNLPPGEYTFKIKGANYNGKWASSIRELKIIVHPPFWKSFWFIGTCILVIILAIVVIYRIRLKHLKRQKRELEFLVNKRTTQLQAKNIELESHHERLERLVDDRTKDLVIAKNKAEKSDQLKTAFLANMSHEIRTPLNAIVGFSSLLTSDDMEEDKKKDFAEAVLNSTDDLLHLVDDIIDLSRIESDDLKITPKNCNLNQLFFEITPVIESLLFRYKKTEQIQYKVHTSKSNICCITDGSRIKQVLINLISNAIKFTESGVIEFGYKLAPSKNDHEDHEVVLFVKDSGVGISPEIVNTIFDRFTKANESSTKLYRGAGLGLAISKSVVKLLGGRIWVNSTVGKGSLFEFTIPYQPVTVASHSDEQNLEPTENIISNVNWQDRIILVAEDEDSNFDYLEAALTKTNAKLVRAFNGLEAVDIFLSQKFDLILMDMRMPEMDGYEATKKIRETESEIPVIALTAYGMSDDKEKCLNAGCNAYISKPFMPDDLVTLDKFLIATSG